MLPLRDDDDDVCPLRGELVVEADGEEVPLAVRLEWLGEWVLWSRRCTEDGVGLAGACEWIKGFNLNSCESLGGQFALTLFPFMPFGSHT